MSNNSNSKSNQRSSRSGGADGWMDKLGSFVKLLCLLAAVYFVVRCIDAQENADDLQIEATAPSLKSIKPIGELYVFSAITEEFTIDNVEKVGFFSRKFYKAVQILRMQVSYVLDMDSVEYIFPENPEAGNPNTESANRNSGNDTVLIRLPQPRYVQTTQGSRFLCEVEVPAEQHNAEKSLNILEAKVRSKYDTEANRRQAMTHAREVIASFVQQCGLIPVFEEK